MCFDFYYFIYNIKESLKYMKTKKDITITIDPTLFDIIDQNFDNKSAVIEWIIIDGISKNKDFKKLLESIIYEK